MKIQTYTQDEIGDHDKNWIMFLTKKETGSRRKKIPAPRFLTFFSLADSDALVDEAGYSPPTPCCR